MARGRGRGESGDVGDAFDMLAPVVAPGPSDPAEAPMTPDPPEAAGGPRVGPDPGRSDTAAADPVAVRPAPGDPPVRPPEGTPEPVGTTPVTSESKVTPAPEEDAQPTTARRHIPAWGIAASLVTLGVVVAVLLSTEPWAHAQATSVRRPVHHSHHRSALAFTSAAPVAQPPPAANPSAPGQLVPSGENRSDAFLFLDQGRYYLYTSGTTVIPFLNIPVSTTTDFIHWSAPIDAMKTLPAWAAEPYTWAPDVHRFGSEYVMYFTGYLKALDEQCIGVATGSTPLGPFTAAPQPFICQSGLSGTIDPRVFTDSSGTNWMLFKSDQNAHASPTPTTLWTQRLTPDGLGLVGNPTALMKPDEPWQGTVIEAPDMVEVNGVYWLAYAANWFNQPAYGIGVAWCAGPAGPCADVSDHPLLTTNAQGSGPGEPSFYQDATGVWMLYTPVMSLPGDPPRPVYVTRVGFTPAGTYLAAGGPPPALSVPTGRKTTRSTP
jgi:GH43 family beta-xylosidase